MSASNILATGKQLREKQDQVQQKTFLNWINFYLKRRNLQVEDLLHDFEDGVIICNLVEILSASKLPTKINTSPRFTAQKLENISAALDFLKTKKIDTSTISASDIQNGNKVLILGLLWTLVLRFEVQKYSEDIQELLAWCQEQTADYDNVQITNFTTSWMDGLAFNAIIHHNSPDLIDYQSLDDTTPIENLTNAFNIADEHFDVPKLIDPADVVVQPDEKSVITYIARLKQSFSKPIEEEVQEEQVQEEEEEEEEVTQEEEEEEEQVQEEVIEEEVVQVEENVFIQTETEVIEEPEKELEEPPQVSRIEENNVEEEQQQPQVRPRSNTFEKKIENSFIAFRQSVGELLGTKNWKSLFGEELQFSQDPQVEKALGRLQNLFALYSQMSQTLMAYSKAWGMLVSAEENLGRFFSESSLHEENAEIHSEMTLFGAKHKRFIPAWEEIHSNARQFSEHTTIFLEKAIEDCYLTTKKHKSQRLEYDGYQTKVVSLETKIQRESTPKLEKELAQAKEDLEISRKQYQDISLQLITKVETLYEMKMTNLKIHFQKITKTTTLLFTELVRVNELSEFDHGNHSDDEHFNSTENY